MINGEEVLNILFFLDFPLAEASLLLLNISEA